MSRTGKSRETKKQISGCLGQGGRVRERNGSIGGYGASFWGDKKVLKLDCGYGYTNMWIY